MGAVSPIFRRLGLTGNGLEWLAAPLPLAHPLDDGRVAVLSRSMSETDASLDGDGGAWVRLLEPFVNRHEEFFSGILRPVRVPAASLVDGAVRARRTLSSDHLARRFEGVAARALFAGNAAHSCLALDAPASAAIGLVLAIAGHAVDWPCARGGSQAIADALAARARSSGCADPHRCARSIARRHPGLPCRAARRHPASAPRHRRGRSDGAVSPPAPGFQVRSRGVQDRLRLVREDSLAIEPVR